MKRVAMKSRVPECASSTDFTAGIKTGKITGKSIAKRSISLPLEFATRGESSVMATEIGATEISNAARVSKKSPSRLKRA